MLDSADIWEECKPKLGKCPICKGKNYNIRVGFLRRSTGEVRQVFIGNRCIECGTLGSYVDWDINYAPTDEMEKIYNGFLQNIPFVVTTPVFSLKIYLLSS